MQAEAHQAAQGLLEAKDWWYLIATIASPFLAAGLTALLTLYWQHRKEERDAKLKVFSSLMAVRGNILNFQAAQEWVRSLHLIDVVFADAPDVLRLWHELYVMLQQQEAPPGQGHKMIELLSAMAMHLGFKTLAQTDIDKAHYPRAISDPIARANEVQEELLRVLKKTDNLLVQPIQTEVIPPHPTQPPRPHSR
jgi:hypothetical protein